MAIGTRQINDLIKNAERRGRNLYCSRAYKIVNGVILHELRVICARKYKGVTQVRSTNGEWCIIDNATTFDER